MISTMPLIQPRSVVWRSVKLNEEMIRVCWLVREFLTLSRARKTANIHVFAYKGASIILKLYLDSCHVFSE